MASILISGKEVSDIIGHTAEEYDAFYRVLKGYKSIGNPKKLHYCACFERPDVEESCGRMVYHIVERSDQSILKILTMEGSILKDTRKLENGRFSEEILVLSKEYSNLDDLGTYEIFLKRANINELFKHSLIGGCHGMLTVMDIFNRKEIKIPGVRSMEHLKRTEDSGSISLDEYDNMDLKIGEYQEKQILYCLGGDGGHGITIGPSETKLNTIFTPGNKQNN